MPKTKKTLAAPAPEFERDSIPRATITLTDESVYLTRHDRTGAPTATYPVSAAAVANAFNQFGANTGLLPANTLFWQSRSGQSRIGVYIQPGRHTLNIRTGKRLEHWTVPLPGFVFVGTGNRYTILAAPARPARDTEQLYHCPLPNVYEDGHICVGTVPFPVCGMDTITQAVTLFFDSEFNHDLAGADTLNLLKSLNGKRGFPNKSLRPAITLADVINERRTGHPIGYGPVGDEDDEVAHGIDGIDPYELAYNGLDEDEDDDED